MTDTLKSWLFVALQALLLGIIIFTPGKIVASTSPLQYAGWVLKILGGLILIKSLYDLRKSLTALPMPVRNGELQVQGLYKYVRHPMYSGVLILSTGIAITGGSLLKLGAVVGLIILFSFKARYEERLLVQRYAGYADYMKHTPRFIVIPRQRS